MSINVRDHNYHFVMNTDVPFGEERYTDSHLGNLTDAGWFCLIERDKDVSLLVGMLANSRADQNRLVEQFDKNPNDFEMLKEDLVKSDLSRIVAIHLGWGDFENLTDYLYNELDNMVDSGDISREGADKIVDNLTGEDVYKMAENIYEFSKEEIISGIKSSKNLKDLFKFLKDGAFNIIWHYANSSVIEFIISKGSEV